MKRQILFDAFFFTSPKRAILKSIIFLLISGLLLNGCYANKSVIGRRNSERYLSELNNSVNDKTGQIELMNGESFIGKSIAVKQDSTFWRETETGLLRSVETSHIKSISIKRRNALKGLGSGFLIGAATGMTLGLLLGVDDCDGDHICFKRGPLAVTGAVLVAVPFGLIGLAGGANTKTSLSYQFEHAKTEP